MWHEKYTLVVGPIVVCIKTRLLIWKLKGDALSLRFVFIVLAEKEQEGSVYAVGRKYVADQETKQ